MRVLLLCGTCLGFSSSSSPRVGSYFGIGIYLVTTYKPVRQIEN